MAITKPVVTGYSALKVVKKDELVNINLDENYDYLYTDEITLQAGETYYTEALIPNDHTALFLWDGDVLLTKGKDAIKYTNDGLGTQTIQLVVKKYSPTNENGETLPSGTYSVWKSPVSFSDGSTELPILCVNSYIVFEDIGWKNGFTFRKDDGSDNIYVVKVKGILPEVLVNEGSSYYELLKIDKYDENGVFISSSGEINISDTLKFPNTSYNIDLQGWNFVAGRFYKGGDTIMVPIIEMDNIEVSTANLGFLVINISDFSSYLLPKIINNFQELYSFYIEFDFTDSLLAVFSPKYDYIELLGEIENRYNDVGGIYVFSHSPTGYSLLQEIDGYTYLNRGSYTENGYGGLEISGDENSYTILINSVTSIGAV